MSNHANLLGISNTDWMTVYARYLASKKKNVYHKDTFSEWFIEKFGVPEAVYSVNKSVLYDLPARSSYFEVLIKQELNKARALNYQVDIWSIKPGFDSRWARLSPEFGKTINEYWEIESAEVINQKKTIIENSPFEEVYSKVKVLTGEVIKNLPESLPETNQRVLIPLEGIMMHFKKKDYLNFLSSIKQRAAEPIVFIEGLSNFLLRMMDRKNAKYTVDPDFHFAWGPDNIEGFLKFQGWDVLESESALKNMFRKNKMFARFIPLPRFVTRHYRLIKMVPGSKQGE